MPLFSIITPTLQRDSLLKCCESVDAQTFTDWQHIVVDDSDQDRGMLTKVKHERRWFGLCATPHRNYGNTCRHAAWRVAMGTWVLYLDDDNYLADDRVLERIAKSLEGRSEQWALFPIMRHGHRFYRDPPGTCYVDTANMVIRREVAQWPDGPEYTMDGIFCERLRDKYPYAAFPDVEPIVIMEHSLEGK